MYFKIKGTYFEICALCFRFNVLFRVHGYVCKNKQQLNSIIKAKIINFAL